MNAHATTEIRELTAQELNLVTGGFSRDTSYELGRGFVCLMIGGAIVGAIGGLLEWLFD
jgi:hypothetical protein